LRCIFSEKKNEPISTKRGNVGIFFTGDVITPFQGVKYKNVTQGNADGDSGGFCPHNTVEKEIMLRRGKFQKNTIQRYLYLEE